MQYCSRKSTKLVWEKRKIKGNLGFLERLTRNTSLQTEESCQLGQLSLG